VTLPLRRIWDPFDDVAHSPCTPSQSWMVGVSFGGALFHLHHHHPPQCRGLAAGDARAGLSVYSWHCPPTEEPNLGLARLQDSSNAPNQAPIVL